jgi:hypothetical protein
MLDEPPEMLLVVMLLGEDGAGVVMYEGAIVIPISGAALASHWQGNTEKFIRS